MKNILLFEEIELFSGINEEEIKKINNCLSAHKKTYTQDSFIFSAGDPVLFVYLLLSGKVHIIDEDFWGNRSIIETMTSNTLFGEAYVLSKAERHIVSVVAAEDSEILIINPVKLFETCSCACSCHAKLIENTSRILSEKIVRLTKKLGHIIRRTMREKIISYLSGCARQAQSNSFFIPYSRQQLADYLCVDRSALSHELSNLHSLDMIRYKKNHFELLTDFHEDF